MFDHVEGLSCSKAWSQEPLQHEWPGKSLPQAVPASSRTFWKLRLLSPPSPHCLATSPLPRVHGSSFAWHTSSISRQWRRRQKSSNKFPLPALYLLSDENEDNKRRKQHLLRKRALFEISSLYRIEGEKNETAREREIGLLPFLKHYMNMNIEYFMCVLWWQELSWRRRSPDLTHKSMQVIIIIVRHQPYLLVGLPASLSEAPLNPPKSVLFTLHLFLEARGRVWGGGGEAWRSRSRGGMGGPIKTWEQEDHEKEKGFFFFQSSACRRDKEVRQTSFSVHAWWMKEVFWLELLGSLDIENPVISILTSTCNVRECRAQFRIRGQSFFLMGQLIVGNSLWVVEATIQKKINT